MNYESHYVNQRAAARTILNTVFAVFSSISTPLPAQWASLHGQRLFQLD